MQQIVLRNIFTIICCSLETKVSAFRRAAVTERLNLHPVLNNIFCRVTIFQAQKIQEVSMLFFHHELLKNALDASHEGHISTSEYTQNTYERVH